MKGIKLIILLVVFLNLINSSMAQAQSAEVSLEFNYDKKTESYYEVLSRAPVACGKIDLLYNRERREILFNNQSILWVRYSFNGWETCQDLVMNYDEEKKQFSSMIELPENVNYVSIAFFSTYENERKWHVLWDSKYGENFYVRIINKKDMEDKRKFDLLNQS